MLQVPEPSAQYLTCRFGPYFQKLHRFRFSLLAIIRCRSPSQTTNILRFPSDVECIMRDWNFGKFITHNEILGLCTRFNSYGIWWKPTFQKVRSKYLRRLGKHFPFNETEWIRSECGDSVLSINQHDRLKSATIHALSMVGEWGNGRILSKAKFIKHPPHLPYSIYPYLNPVPGQTLCFIKIDLICYLRVNCRIYRVISIFPGLCSW